MQPFELKKSIVLQITALILMLRKHDLFFWELKNIRAILQNVRDTLITIFSEAPCTKSANLEKLRALKTY